ncbi:MAG: hypothetical protein GEV06_12580 [Luteitalea sp.]|nr:hypothetical protein [Luteitalea sp.]
MTVAPAIASVVYVVPPARATLLLALLLSVAWSFPVAAQQTSPRPTIGPEAALQQQEHEIAAELDEVKREAEALSEALKALERPQAAPGQ